MKPSESRSASSRPAVLVTRRIPDAGLALLEARCEVQVWSGALPPERGWLLENVRGMAGVLALLTERIDRELLDAAGDGLRVVSNFAVGLDNVDLAEATRRGIQVGHTPDVLTETTADLAFALLLAAARRLPEAERYVKEGRWKTWEPQLLLGTEVHGATLGIIGLGRIGRAVARRALGFSMRVLAVGGRELGTEGTVEGVQRVDLETLLAESDFVSLHAPLNEKTRGLFNDAAFARMKRGAVLVNTARGPAVDTGALERALRSGQLGAAALDVTDPEPLPADHPLLSLPNCLVIPHLGSGTVATRNRMATVAAENLLAGVEGRRLPFPANPAVAPGAR